MLYSRLLKDAIQVYSTHPLKVQSFSGRNVFTSGGIWMAEMLAVIRNRPVVAENIPFNYYGYGKYGMALSFMGIVAFVLFPICPIAVPLAIPAFYWMEVQFLFLFPLLVDGTRHPIRNSIRWVHRIGTVQAVFNVMAIALYMLSGLLNKKMPLYRWYVGCTAILIWYDETMEHRQ